MDWATSINKLASYGKKYRYALLILILGIILMLIPTGKKQSKETTVVDTQSVNTYSVSDELSEILSKIEGVGKAQVMLTVSTGEETIYQSDSDGAIDSQDRTTVTVTDGDRNETGLIRQINPPVYLGAIVVCQGADSPSVRLEIVEAVSRITGLGTDRISVLKMK